jgi:hypothetical protein
VHAVTAPIDEHSATVPAPPPEGCEDAEGDEHETMLPPAPETERSRR